MNSRPASVEMLTESRVSECLATLTELKATYGACSLKLSTEDAAMGFEQIAQWTRRCQGMMPVIVKIGGPNARNDIRELVRIGVDGLIAPMVESAYGLENFIEAVEDCTTPQEFRRIKKQINIETRTAARDLASILQHSKAGMLDEITIGCSDLSKSMGLKVEDASVTRLVGGCVRKIRESGHEVSIGGGITPANIQSRLELLEPTHFNTRVVTFRSTSGPDFAEAVRLALRFEMDMLSQDREEGFLTLQESENRIRELSQRLA